MGIGETAFCLVAVRLSGFRFTCFTYFETHTVFLRILQFCTKILQNAKMRKNILYFDFR